MTGVRPHALGTFALLYSLGRTGALRGALAAAVPCLGYPYLAWMYVGPMVVAHGLRGSRSLAAGAAAVLVATMALEPTDTWVLVWELARSGAVREAIGMRITEFAPITAHPGIAAAVIVFGLWLWPRLSEEERRLQPAHVMVLLFLPISLRYIRYVADVQLPLLFAAHGASALRALRVPVARLLQRADANVAPERAPAAATPGASRRARLPFRIAVAIAWLVLLGALTLRVARHHRRLSRDAVALSDVPEGSLAVTRFNRQYRLLYARPDLRLIPSCEAGFPAPAIEAAYVGFLKHGRVCTLAGATGATHFLDDGQGYLDPLDTGCLRPTFDPHEPGDGLRVWRVLPAAE